ncbi:flagellar basal-body rod modification protein FlgD [Chromobacterium alkanivorans]|uniref:flagellar hook assembly protein FlgD n=1 Tax=Chromobacterium TaxID=535 RepID=UPI00069D3741|nr:MULTISPECIES: flagellar hook capping FlgD N-terminal domain-containing protein [Chromobacterium]MBN3003174.1 flagellar hook capping protein [Chromobacterium alkanivorans]MCS3803648.1 flagellar basal-body rod modification protein FlgD [Chromobacterium alkanivorans]MCS3818247.1 flagellar basal-body rod modification protein FlgD [Chromobacterium alkanivorans]MCS3874554.1 flagellar basal-body rod modification protein FlgD [Chromobacterium alkanivorans]
MASANPYDVLNSQTQTNPNSSVNGSKSNSGVVGSSASDIQSTFLKLFVAQMRSQDPMNPMDNSQMTAQMAQISQVGGIQQLNQSMQALIGAQAASQSLMASSMIGKKVLVAGSDLPKPPDGGTSPAGVLLNGPAQTVKVSVKDANGNVVRTMTIDKPVAGVNTFSWDGKNDKGEVVPAGKYSFSADVTQASANGSTTAVAYNTQTVTAVAWDQGVPELVLPDGSRAQLGDVAQMTA